MASTGRDIPEAMEARSVDSIPHGDVWRYEPKWDGFRCLLSRHGRRVQLRSKSGQDLTRYFPELAHAAAELQETTFLLDGEIEVPDGKTFSFDHLLQRIHPAPSRIKRLSVETPAIFIAFDLLQRGRVNLARANLSARRPELEQFAAHCFSRAGSFRLSPMSARVADAKRWLESAGGGCDGVIAKRADMPYQSGNRDGMRKIKRHRTADCVIGGFRYGERKQGGRKVVGSLLLGLYDTVGDLHHVGFTSAIKADEKEALTDKLEAIAAERSFTGTIPGGPSRWSTKRSAQWQAVKPTFVVEVSYDHFTGGRFRHGTSLLRWRPDKKAKQCTMEQLRQKVIVPESLLRARI